MTLDSKKDLDALLRRWPALAPGKERGVVEHEDNADWEGRADAIVHAATMAGPFEATVLARLEAPPALSAEAGEPESDSARGAAGEKEKKMSQENGSGGSPTSRESSSAPTPSSPERKRPSLKAIAERASQSGSRASATPIASGRASTPSTSTPIPSRPAAASRPAIPAAPVSHPAEAGKEDSGVINLNAVNASATPEQVAAAEKAQPGSASLSEDEKQAAAAAPVTAKSAEVVSIAKKAKSTKNNGALTGLAIAALGLAAAFAIMQTQKSAPTVATPSPQPPPAATAEATLAPPAPAEAAPSTVALATAAPTVEASAAPGKGEPPKVAAASPGGAAAAAAAAPKETPPSADGEEKVAQPANPAAPSGKEGDLNSAIAKAVGAKEQVRDSSGATPEPAAGNPKSVPEQPAQGSVASAVNSVMGGAKACVSGADDVSRANVTFSSNGTVSNVTVTGWAASNGKADCIKAAVKGAQVGPFSKPAYTVPMTIRP